MKLVSPFFKTILLIPILLTLAMISNPAAAVLVSLDFNGNDCSGVFDPQFEESYFLRTDLPKGERSFDDCWIFAADFPDELISPVIGKFEPSQNGGFNLSDVSGNFPDVDGGEWEFMLDADGDLSQGNWTYNPDEGEDDPGIRFWVAKAGDGFTLYWEVSDEDYANLCGGGASVNTLACMSAAETITAGSWDTGMQDLSHITFYNTGLEPPSQVSEGNTTALFTLGLIGLLTARRQSKINRQT
ncbi:hypothetical protein [Thalassotalea mangrovi]|uniref:PEP-CTERM sorting domain-containing protein n=1 Tax=Thalassotalea mangrovi TaxID=2572245 RepID=A0A4U1B3Y0_9GAMM|nr:hypothetical protein [Thalassotalea mangrovi]TKB43967.1 hypothetical protein E8M12_13400 [Thalassotalea mangrovi]